MSRYLGDNIRIEPCPNSVLFLDPGWIRGDPGRVLLNPFYPKVDPGWSGFWIYIYVCVKVFIKNCCI